MYRREWHCIARLCWCAVKKLLTHSIKKGLSDYLTGVLEWWGLFWRTEERHDQMIRTLSLMYKLFWWLIFVFFIYSQFVPVALFSCVSLTTYCMVCSCHILVGINWSPASDWTFAWTWESLNETTNFCFIENLPPFKAGCLSFWVDLILTCSKVCLSFILNVITLPVNQGRNVRVCLYVHLSGWRSVRMCVSRISQQGVSCIS